MSPGDDRRAEGRQRRAARAQAIRRREPAEEMGRARGRGHGRRYHHGLAVIHLCITPERQQKTRMLMSALAGGIGLSAHLVLGEPPDDGAPFVVWGQEWLTL